MKDEIYLRPLREEDAKTSWRWRNDPRVWDEGSRKKTVVVFGATGHLGCYSALRLARDGWNVIAVGRRESDGGFFAQHGISYVGGVVLETPGWGKKLEQFPKIDAVVDMAGTMPAHSSPSPMPYVQGIVAAIVNVCEWMRKRDVKRIVFNTTPSDVCAQFGLRKPVSDDAPRSFPKNGNDHAVYAICKNAAVDILEHYSIKYGFKPCVFRHFTVYGWHPNALYSLEGETRVLPYRRMIRDAIAGRRLVVWGDPNVTRDLLYIEDFAEAVSIAAGCEATGLFNIVGKERYTIAEQVSTIARVFSSKFAGIDFAPEKPSAPWLQLSGEKAARELGWRGKWSWEDACRDMKRYHQNNIFEPLWGAVDPEDVIRE